MWQADGPLSDEASEEQAAQQAAHKAFIKGAVAEVLLDSIFNQFGDDWTFILELATMIRSFPGFPELLQTVYDRYNKLPIFRSMHRLKLYLFTMTTKFTTKVATLGLRKMHSRLR